MRTRGQRIRIGIKQQVDFILTKLDDLNYKYDIDFKLDFKEM